MGSWILHGLQRDAFAQFWQGRPIWRTSYFLSEASESVSKVSQPWSSVKEQSTGCKETFVFQFSSLPNSGILNPCFFSMCVQVHVYIYACESQRSVFGVISQLVCHLALHLLSSFSLIDSESHKPTSLCSSSVLGLQMDTTTMGFSYGFWDSNRGPHDYVPDTLLTEHLSSPWISKFYVLGTLRSWR